MCLAKVWRHNSDAQGLKHLGFEARLNMLQMQKHPAIQQQQAILDGKSDLGLG
jgi:hypothetical protein